MTAGFAGSQYALTGYMTQSKTPIVDLYAASDHVRPEPLARLAPKSLGKAALLASGPASVRLAIIGPADNPDLRLQVGMEQPVSVRVSELGMVQAKGLRIAADVVAAAKPSVRATVTGSEFSVPSLKVATAANGWPKSVTASPAQAFSASVQWCGQASVAQADLRVPLLVADRLHVTNLRTQATLIKDLLRLRDLSANALGGKLAADVVLALKGPQRGLRGKGDIKGLDLARLQELPLRLKEPLTGSANATFEGQATEKSLSGAVTLQAANVKSGDISVGSANATLALERAEVWRGAGLVQAQDVATKELDATRAEGLLEVRGDALTVHSAFFEARDGVGWGRGEANLRDHTLDLQVRGAELAVSRLAPLLGLKDMKGTAYASGTVTGTAEQPNFQGKLIVFKPQVKDYELDALEASVRLQGDSLEANDFLVSRGSGIVSGQGTINHLGAPPEQMAVQAQIQGEGIRIADVAKLVKQDWPADGLGEFTASVSGSMARPQARGVIRVSNAHYDDVPIARAELPFALDQER